MKKLIPVIKQALMLVFVLALIVFVGRYLAGQWDEIRQDIAGMNWQIFIVAQLGMALGYGILPLAALLSLRFTGQHQPALRVWHMFYLSSLAKYLPGGVWALPGRIFLYQRAGISAKRGTVALVWEIAVMVISGLVVALLSFGLMTHYISLTIIVILAVAGLTGISAASLVAHSGGLRARIVRLPLPALVQEILMRADLWLNLRQQASIFSVYLLSWGVLGLSFGGMVYALNPELATWHWVQMIGVFSGAWVAGFLVIIAPGGVGVRDVLIVLALAVFLPEPTPAVVAILARIGWTVAEIIGVSITGALGYFRPDLTAASATIEEHPFPTDI